MGGGGGGGGDVEWEDQYLSYTELKHSVCCYV